MLEGLLKAIKRGPVSKQPELETIPEVASSQDRNESVVDLAPQQELRGQNQTHSMNMESIPEVDELQARELWERRCIKMLGKIGRMTMFPHLSVR